MNDKQAPRHLRRCTTFDSSDRRQTHPYLQDTLLQIVRKRCTLCLLDDLLTLTSHKHYLQAENFHLRDIRGKHQRIKSTAIYWQTI